MSCLPSLRHSSHTEPVSNTCTCVKPGTGPVTVQDIRSVTTALTAVISGDAGECGEVFADAVTPVAFLDVLAAAAFTADPVTSPRQECTDWSTETVESAMSARTMAMPVRPSILRGPSSPHAATPLPSYFATKPAFRDRGDSVGSHSGSCSTAVTADQSGSELLLSLRGKRKSTGNIPEPIERSSSPADSSEDEESVDEGQ